jgi:hypothetical protein
LDDLWLEICVCGIGHWGLRFSRDWFRFRSLRGRFLLWFPTGAIGFAREERTVLVETREARYRGGKSGSFERRGQGVLLFLLASFDELVPVVSCEGLSFGVELSI